MKKKELNEEIARLRGENEALAGQNAELITHANEGMVTLATQLEALAVQYDELEKLYAESLKANEQLRLELAEIITWQTEGGK